MKCLHLKYQQVCIFLAFGQKNCTSSQEGQDCDKPAYSKFRDEMMAINNKKWPEVVSVLYEDSKVLPPQQFDSSHKIICTFG